MCTFIPFLFSASIGIIQDPDKPARLESPSLSFEVHPLTGMWFFIDKRSAVRWPGESAASAGAGSGLEGGFDRVESTATRVRLSKGTGNAVTFELVDEGRTVRIGYEGKDLGDVRALEDLTVVTDRDTGAVIVPCREGLLIPAESGVAFRHTFGTSEYEGCHMNMLGLLKGGGCSPGHLGRCQRVARDRQHAGDREAPPPGGPDLLHAQAAGPDDPPDPAGQGRLERPGRRLSEDRRDERARRHAPGQGPPQCPCGAPAGRSQREALDLPGAAAE